jgi:hypothetical protein
MRSRLIEKEGPTGLITTTTSASLHPENETRMLSLSIKDSPEQTKAVLAKTAQRQAAALRDLSAWVAFQGWLATGERRVAIPYAEQLAEKIRPVAVRLRRDFRAVLSLIEACALLHRNSRERDGQGRIVATLEDYAIVHGLVSPLITEAAGAAVSETVRDTVKAVAEFMADGREYVSFKELADVLNLDVRSVRHRVNKGIDGGFLQNLEMKSRRKAKIVLGEQLPQDNSVLPSADGVFPGEGVKIECPSDPPSGYACHDNGLDGKVLGQTVSPENRWDKAASAANNLATQANPVGGTLEHGISDPSPETTLAASVKGIQPPCAQCNHADGQAVRFGDVWLHSECRRIWFRDHPEKETVK